MSDVKWTNEQINAIEEKGSNLLVAAAAGSGKTAVLVERIIHKIIDEKMDIDRMLVVTFTNAAASEMRERILDAIYEKMDKNPDDVHLKKQITLLNKANISTIHSFCLDIIRNYFYEIDISASFQIGDTEEMELLKNKTIEDLFEEKYNQKDEHFLKLIDTYATYKGDDELKNIVFRIDNKIQSMPFPKDWLEEKVEMFNLKDKLSEDFSKTIWGELILKELEEEIKENRLKLDKICRNLKKYPELEKYFLTVLNDKEQLELIESVIGNEEEKSKWDKVFELSQNLRFEKWPIDRKIDIDYKNEAKEQRDKIKKDVNKILSKTMLYTSKEANEVIYEMYDYLCYIKELVLDFEEKFAVNKKDRNRIDFHDIEHFALKILLKKDEDGNVIKSEVAKQLQEKFDEIAIDEYQDSNLVQEYILNSVSKGNNIFMVGDIKQSIYRFREARPELFIEKYKNYEECLFRDGSKRDISGQKIKLFKNFRSRKEVLDLTNWVFEELMSEKLGDVEYNEEEYLNLGASYEEDGNMLPELHILDLAKDEENDIWKSEEDNQNEEIESETEEELIDNIEQEEQILEKNEEEAKMVALRIEELFKQGFIVTDKKKGKRKIEYKDIAILLRSTANAAPIYEKELLSRNIPVFCDTSTQYLDRLEVQTILALLKIIDNPMQDIPLIHVMRSMIGGFTDNELVEIRLVDSKCTFYESILKARISVREDLKNKIDYFLNSIQNWRELEKEIPLNELVWKIYSDTNYYNYVGMLTNGTLRQANLKLLFEKAKQFESASFKGLYNFIHFIDRLRMKNSDMGEAKIIGENDNVVRIMSIHKSKGLEFPVVFLSNVSKKFNKQDLTDRVLIHADLGFGTKNIDNLSKIEYDSLSKEAIKLKMEQEMISEEMRILYVALTRAKEKLIITGVSKDWKKYIKDRQDTLSIYCDNESVNSKTKLELRLIKKYISYLDWLTLLMLKDKDQNKIKLEVHKIEDLKNNKEEQTIENELEDETKMEEEEKEIIKEKLDKIEDSLNWKYPYIISSLIPTKTSVSKLKEDKIEQELSNEDVAVDFEELIERKEKNLKEPSFIVKEEDKISSARKRKLSTFMLAKIRQ